MSFDKTRLEETIENLKRYASDALLSATNDATVTIAGKLMLAVKHLMSILSEISMIEGAAAPNNPVGEDEEEGPEEVNLDYAFDNQPCFRGVRMRRELSPQDRWVDELLVLGKAYLAQQHPQDTSGLAHTVQSLELTLSGTNDEELKTRLRATINKYVDLLDELSTRKGDQHGEDTGTTGKGDFEELGEAVGVYQGAVVSELPLLHPDDVGRYQPEGRGEGDSSDGSGTDPAGGGDLG